MSVVPRVRIARDDSVAPLPITPPAHAVQPATPPALTMHER
jgi:hypothetical protein